MKAFIATLVLLSSLSALACQREAQFIGKAKNVQVITDVDGNSVLTSFQIKLTNWFQPSMVCPMDEVEAEEAVIEVPGVFYISEGQEISGVLVYNEQLGTYSIE
ncbi:MAG: hypothetical protein K2P81_03140 [Bacteriovoracaceae bacterium]|nr:hypothetical protein [Bacteriovoracaceae bacterium]